MGLFNPIINFPRVVEYYLIKAYHGTNYSSAYDIWHNGIDLNKSMPNLDFGKGFYVTDDKQKAIDRARKKTNDYNRRYKKTEAPYLVEMNIDTDIFNSLRVKSFGNRETEWFRFVIYNRLSIDFLNLHNISNHNKDNKFDVVIGEIADGKIATIANDIKNGICSIDDVDFDSILQDSKKFYGTQYSFHTEQSLSCIKGLSCGIIHPYTK